jgi:heme iron utilization protein
MDRIPMNKLPKASPIRPTDAEARALARSLIDGARAGMLATLQSDGHPFASLTSLALDTDRTPLILVSQLSAHTGNLLRDPRASLLIASGGKGDPLAHPRITLQVRAEPVPRDTPQHVIARAGFLAHQPKAALYIDFADFLLVRLAIRHASLNGGFGKAYELTQEDLVPEDLAPDAPVG